MLENRSTIVIIGRQDWWSANEGPAGFITESELIPPETTLLGLGSAQIAVDQTSLNSGITRSP